MGDTDFQNSVQDIMRANQDRWSLPANVTRLMDVLDPLLPKNFHDPKAIAQIVDDTIGTTKSPSPHAEAVRTQLEQCNARLADLAEKLQP